jgi:YD repeat-containing protein
LHAATWKTAAIGIRAWQKSSRPLPQGAAHSLIRILLSNLKWLRKIDDVAKHRRLHIGSSRKARWHGSSKPDIGAGVRRDLASPNGFLGAQAPHHCASILRWRTAAGADDYTYDPDGHLISVTRANAPSAQFLPKIYNEAQVVGSIAQLLQAMAGFDGAAAQARARIPSPSVPPRHSSRF